MDSLSTENRSIDKVAYKKTNALGIIDWEVKSIKSFKELTPSQKVECIKKSLVQFLDEQGNVIPINEALKLLRS